MQGMVLERETAESRIGRFGFSYYVLLIYLFFEYGRPQSFFPVIGLLHPGWIILSLLFLRLFSKRKFMDLSIGENRCFIGLILLMLVHVFIAANNHWAYQMLRSVVLYFVAYLSIVNFVDSYEKLERYIDIWLTINIICAVIGIMNGGRVPFSGFMEDENDFSLVMNMALPFSYFMFLSTRSMNKKLFYVVAGSLFMFANVASLSRGGFIGLVSVFAYCWYKNPKKVLSTFMIAITAGFLYFAASPSYWDEVKTIKDENIETGTGEERWYSWKIAWRMFQNHPIIGVGQGNYMILASDYQTSEELSRRRPLWGRQAHSVYLTLLPELGLIGAALFGGLLVYSWRDLRRISMMETQLVSNHPEISNEAETIHRLRRLRYAGYGISGSLIGYLISGSFLSVLYYPHLWLLVALSISAGKVGKSIILDKEEPLPKSHQEAGALMPGVRQ
jgi:O-antigen ligase